MNAQPKVALVIGAGDATGSAVARRFAEEGYYACLVRRNGDKLIPIVTEMQEAGLQAQGFGVDARKEEQVEELINTIESSIGPIEVFVFNIGANVPSSILDETAQKYFKIWEMACFSAFLTGRAVAQRMVQRERGTMIFTGATASVRGGAHFAAFAGAKHALRALAQSMARELGPRGIHVVHSIIDGIIDTQFAQDLLGANFETRKNDQGIINPKHIADSYWHVHSQEKDCWTHELDMRPYNERW